MLLSSVRRWLIFASLPFLLLTSPARGDVTAPNRIPFTVAFVSDDDGTYTVTWRANHVTRVQVFAVVDPDHMVAAQMVGEGAGSGRVKVTGLTSAARWYFELRPDHGHSLIIADRSLHLMTAGNFRDAGGYRTESGAWVRMGLVYRSNGLEHLTDDELGVIGRLQIRLICDLRTEEEVHRGPDRVPTGVKDISADVLADDASYLHSVLTGQNGQRDDGAAGFSVRKQEQIYRDFVRLPSARKSYRKLMERLADRTELPTVFHCTAGKDRTGWAQVILLSILGVPRSTIFEDYLLTNVYLRGPAIRSVQQSVKPVSASALTAHRKVLNAAFDELSRRYGSFNRYLREGLELSDATLTAIQRNLLMH